MGYRGDDASRPWADSRRQQPWLSSEQDPRRDGYGNQAGSYGAPDGYGRPAGGFPDNDWYGDNAARVTQTRQQPVLDDRQYDGSQYEAAYPGYENVDDRSGNDGYRSQRAYDDDYDDYADFTPGYDMRQAPTTGNPAYTEPAPTAGNPVYAADEPGEFGAGPGYAPGVMDGYDDGFGGQDVFGRQGPAAGAGNQVPGTGNRRAGRPGPPGRARPGGLGKAGNRKRAVLGASALCLVGALAAIYFLLIMPGNEEATANSPLPSPGSTSSATAACTQKYGPYCHITYRSEDPKPLSVSELFPRAVFNEKDHVSFQQIGTRTDKTCSDAALGNSLQDALGSKECSQALRASYVSGSGSREIMGTIGVFNLNSANQAHSAGKLVGSNDFISPLATSSGVGANLGHSTGVMQAQYKGHYLILTWAELANEATPTSSDNHKLEQFENDLVASTANIALSQRMVTGKPG